MAERGCVPPNSSLHPPHSEKGFTMKLEKQQQILGCMADVLNQNGFRAEVMQQEGSPLLLRCEAMRQGKVQKDVTIECCFIPIALPGEDTGLLQFFTTLFTNVPETNFRNLRNACDYCNDFCALGHFGLFADAGQLYLKHTTLLDSALELEQVITFFADNISLLMASFTRFIDGLASIGFSACRWKPRLSRNCCRKCKERDFSGSPFCSQKNFQKIRTE